MTVVLFHVPYCAVCSVDDCNMRQRSRWRWRGMRLWMGGWVPRRVLLSSNIIVVFVVIVVSRRSWKTLQPSPWRPVQVCHVANIWLGVHFEAERVGTPFPMLKSCWNEWERRSHFKVFKNASWTALRTIFQPKCITLQFCVYSLKIFFSGIIAGLHKHAPGAWTQTPISALLASVPIVPVLRNDH